MNDMYVRWFYKGMYEHDYKIAAVALINIYKADADAVETIASMLSDVALNTNDHKVLEKEKVAN